jgi:hypothetical protein
MLQEIDIFSLETHDGPYEKWPLKTRLFKHGTPTTLTLPGYILLHQYKTKAGYFLFVTDWDCPYEEMTHFILTDEHLRIRSSRQLGGPYVSYLLTAFSPQPDGSAIATFGMDSGNDRHYRLKIRDFSFFWIWPKLSLRRCSHPK